MTETQEREPMVAGDEAQPETEAPEIATELAAEVPPEVELSIEGYEGMSPERQQIVKKSFVELSHHFGLSRELLYRLIGGRVEMSQNGEGHEKMLAAFEWDTQDGRRLRIYDKAFVGDGSREFSAKEVETRINYLLGHEFSHAAINTGAVTDLESLQSAIIADKEGEDDLRDYLVSYMSRPGVRLLERHFTRDQAEKYMGSQRTSSDQWTFAQEILAERFHEYQSVQGSKEELITRRFTGIDYVGYIVETFPNMGIKPLTEDNDEKRFWGEVGRAFNITIEDHENLIHLYEILGSEGMPLEALKKDIDFWHTTFKEGLGDNPQQKIATYLEAQDAMELEDDFSYEWGDEFVGGDEPSNDWFDESGQAGQMPQESNALGPEGGNVKTVPDKLMDIANMLAGIKK